ncbi:hypothetical protein BGZ94_005182 [Podila epigama]|nr:hypothetical protein BGZ94_005182 [Podila epigama]
MAILGIYDGETVIVTGPAATAITTASSTTSAHSPKLPSKKTHTDSNAREDTSSDAENKEAKKSTVPCHPLFKRIVVNGCEYDYIPACGLPPGFIQDSETSTSEQDVEKTLEADISRTTLEQVGSSGDPNSIVTQLSIPSGDTSVERSEDADKTNITEVATLVTSQNKDSDAVATLGIVKEFTVKGHNDSNCSTVDNSSSDSSINDCNPLANKEDSPVHDCDDLLGDGDSPVNDPDSPMNNDDPSVSGGDVPVAVTATSKQEQQIMPQCSADNSKEKVPIFIELSDGEVDNDEVIFLPRKRPGQRIYKRNEKVARTKLDTAFGSQHCPVEIESESDGETDLAQRPELAHVP